MWFSEKPQSECCPVSLPGDWAVRDIFSHAWPHSHSTMRLWCLSQLWILSDQANVAHRILSSRNCLLFTSLSSRVKVDLSVRKEGYNVRWVGAGKMAKVVKVDKVFAVQAWWSEFRPSEPTERLGGHDVVLWSAVNPASSRSSERPCLHESSGEKCLSVSLWFVCVHTHITHTQIDEAGYRQERCFGKCQLCGNKPPKNGRRGEFMGRNLVLQPRVPGYHSALLLTADGQVAHTTSIYESAVPAAALLTESFNQHNLRQ